LQQTVEIEFRETNTNMKTTKILKALVCGLGMALVLGTGVQAKEAEGEDAKPKMGPKKVLTQFDKDKNGKIEGAEAEELRKAFSGDLKSQLAKLDRDGNGKLDDNEIKAIKSKAAPDAGGTAAPKKGKKPKKPTEDAPVK
jgi:Ca2+-binding EF-hand superfamily protein